MESTQHDEKVSEIEIDQCATLNTHNNCKKDQ